MDVHILGPLEVVDDGGRRLKLGTGRQSALLALLVVNRNEVVRVDRIVDELWADDAPASATKIVQGYVVQLRKLVGGSLVTGAGGYALRLERDQLDAARAEDLLRQGRAALASGDPAHASTTLAGALALWRGPALADFTYDSFAQSEIGRLDELRLELLGERIEADLALGRHASLIGELETLVARNPLRERLRAQLMTALYRSGRQAEALEVYRDAQERLQDELGLEPGPELRELERAILNQEPSLATPSPRSTAVTPRRRARLFAGAVAGALVIAGVAVGLVLALTRGGEKAAASQISNVVAEIDPTRNQVTGRTAVGERPTEVVVAADLAWVLNADAGTVSVIDTSSGALLRTAAVGIGPTDLAVDGKTLFVSDSRLRTVFRLDPETLAVIDRFQLPRPVLRHGLRGYDPVEVGALAVVGRSIWVGGGGENLFRLDSRRRRPAVRVLGVPTLGGPEKALAVDGTSVWARGCCPPALTRVDTRTNTWAAMSPIGAGVDALSGLAAGAGAIWITDASTDDVWEVDPRTSGPLRTIATGSSPAGVAVGFGSVWVANSGDGSVWRIDPLTRRLQAKIDVGGAPAGVAVGAGRVWVTVG